MAKDKKKWVSETDPSGKVHWSHPDTWRTKAGDKAATFVGAGKAMFGFLVLFMLMRFFMESVTGAGSDPIIMGYSGQNYDLWGNPTHFVYFDVFKWLKDFATGVGQFKNVFIDFGNQFSNFVDDNIFVNIINIFCLFIIDIPLMLMKVVCTFLSLICLLIGGPMYNWALPGGWLYEFINFPLVFVFDTVKQGAMDFDWFSVNIGPV